MSDLKPKIVYLFGAGATHAEKMLESKLKQSGLDKYGKLKKGLLAGDVSKRIIDNLLKKKPDMLRNYGIDEFSFDTPWGKKYADIELLISLIETIKNERSEKDAKIFRRYFKKEICENLIIKNVEITPNLYSSLIELQRIESRREKLLGFLTLNYDSLFEKSLSLGGKKLNYGLDVEVNKAKFLKNKYGKVYFLKLHGSFDWYFDQNINKINISASGDEDSMQWIPPRLNKEYSNYPYNAIFGKAEELLRQCDILRIIGCSLSQNDLSLISLLFKTQKSRQQKPYSIEIISSEESYKDLIKNRLGIVLSLNSFYFEEDWEKLGVNKTDNAFLDWLYYKVKYKSSGTILKTKYLKKVEKWIKL